MSGDTSKAVGNLERAILWELVGLCPAEALEAVATLTDYLEDHARAAAEVLEEEKRERELEASRHESPWPT